eukprot:14624215-Ditylum_brightwellii.AAC.1
MAIAMPPVMIMTDSAKISSIRSRRRRTRFYKQSVNAILQQFMGNCHATYAPLATFSVKSKVC